MLRLCSPMTIVILALPMVVVSAAKSTAPSSSTLANSSGVVVYGGTPAGILAAVAASRAGHSVVLIEPSRHIGGMTTGGLSRTDVGRPELIGGLAWEFFERAAKRYDDPEMLRSREKWYSEPHVAEQAFLEMLREAQVTVLTGQRLDLAGGVRKVGARIVAISAESGRTFAGRMFVDASYEGDLMAQAGVAYLVGRESRAAYDEPLAGYYPMPIRPRTPEVMASECPCVGGDGPHYIHGTPARLPARDAAGQLIFGVEEPPRDLEPGDADDRTQAYNFRVLVTRDRQNQVPFPRPADYDATRYELLLRLVAAYPELRFTRLFHLGNVPGGKFDLNAAGLFSTDYAGGNTGYPDGDYATRRRIWQDHVNYVQGLLWFLGHDPRLPQRLRDETNQWGLCQDEFVDNDHWPYQLYVREGRRMIGQYVLKQQDLQRQITKPDSIAMGSFVIDCHIVRRIVTPDGWIADEGSFPDAPARPYQIPYRSLVPRPDQCTNLLVPVCVSASHVAYCSIRMEPQYMMMGHAAGLAAAAAIEGGSDVQDIDVAALQAKLREQGAVLALDVDPGPQSADLPGIVVDDEQAILTGDWVVSNFTAGIDGAYRHDGNQGKGAKSARFDVRVPKDGCYEVRLAWSAFGNRASNVPVTIQSATGSTTVYVDQRKVPAAEKTFTPLGRFWFSAAQPAAITIDTTGTDGYVVADAVQLLPSD